MSEIPHLNFGYDQDSKLPMVEIPHLVWSDMHDTNVAQSKNTGALIGNKGESKILLIEHGAQNTRAMFNLATIGSIRDPQIKHGVLRGLMLFMNGLHAAAGPVRMDPSFMVEGSLVPAVRTNYALRSAVLWPTVPSKLLSQVVGDKMKQARSDLKFGDPKDMNVGAAIGPRTEAVLYVSEERHCALVAKTSRQTPAGLQVLLKSETMPSLEASFVCLVGALALSRASELA